jgi:hypothetical protein
MTGAIPSLMVHALSWFQHEPSAMGLKAAIAVSLTAHALMLLLFLHRPLTPPASRSSGSGPLLMSLKAASPLMPNLVQDNERSNTALSAVAKTDLPKTEFATPVLAKPAETSFASPTKPEESIPQSTPQAATPGEAPEAVEQVLSTPVTKSTPSNAASSSLLPPQMGGQGRWGSRSMPTNRGPQNMNQGPAAVMPLLNRLTGQLPPTASCDIKVIANWNAAFISCSEDSFKGYAVGFLSQQLRIQPTMADPAHCFKLNNGSLNTVDCRH